LYQSKLADRPSSVGVHSSNPPLLQRSVTSLTGHLTISPAAGKKGSLGTSIGLKIEMAVLRIAAVRAPQ
jgi:hypothetical protein